MTTSAKPIRILTVDDHALLREGISAMVTTQPDMTIVAEASNGAEAIDTFGTRAADMDASINAIADLMGHADIHMTRRYAHSTDQGRRFAVEAVAMALKQDTRKTQKVAGNGRS